MKHSSGTIRSAALALIVWLAVACQTKSTPPTTPTASAETFVASTGAKTGFIKTRGIVRPAQTLQLGFRSGGTVHSVHVQVGVYVKEGELLAELDTKPLEFELQKAQALVAMQQAGMSALLNGSDAALVARAETQHAQEVAQAEIALRVAQLQLEQARLQGQTAQQAHSLDIALARAKLEQVDLQLAQASAQVPDAEVVAAQVGLTRARDVLSAAQLEYQKALDRHWEPQEVRDAYAKAVWHAEQEVRLAQARLDGATDAQRAHALGVEMLTIQRRAAGVQLTQTLETGVAFTVPLALLQAEVDRAQLVLDGLGAWQNPYLAPSSPEEIAQARALLRQAELDEEALEWQLAGAQLRAPFDGLISALTVREGEWTAPGEPVVELLDVSRWRVETMNVSELEIARVQPGQEALVRINALPGEELRGRVVMISPVAVVQQGDTTYTLTIELEPTQLVLRPGMTAQVEVLTQ